MFSNTSVVQFGKVFAKPGKGSASIGASFNGMLVSPLWRFWSGGDEFYVAQRDDTKVTKISFHSRGRWKCDSGSTRLYLAPACPLSWPGWSLALQLKILVHSQPRRAPVFSKLKKSSHVHAVDTAPGSKLVVNIVIAPDGTALDSPMPPEADGVRFLALPLRSGRTVLHNCSVHPLIGEDWEFVERMRDTKIGITNPENLPKLPESHGSMMKVTFEPPVNLISVVQFFEECFVPAPAPAK